MKKLLLLVVLIALFCSHSRAGVARSIAINVGELTTDGVKFEIFVRNAPEAPETKLLPFVKITGKGKIILLTDMEQIVPWLKLFENNQLGSEWIEYRYCHVRNESNKISLMLKTSDQKGINIFINKNDAGKLLEFLELGVTISENCQIRPE
jgi:hypothetical protein